MKESLLYLAELAGKLEDLGSGMASGEIVGLESEEINLLLENIRALFSFMEERLDFVARALESKGTGIH